MMKLILLFYGLVLSLSSCGLLTVDSGTNPIIQNGSGSSNLTDASDDPGLDEELPFQLLECIEHEDRRICKGNFGIILGDTHPWAAHGAAIATIRKDADDDYTLFLQDGRYLNYTSIASIFEVFRSTVAQSPECVFHRGISLCVDHKGTYKGDNGEFEDRVARLMLFEENWLMVSFRGGSQYIAPTSEFFQKFKIAD